MLDSQKLRGLRIEFRVETVNLHLPGTVGPGRGRGSKFRRRASAVPNLIAIRFDCSTQKYDSDSDVVPESYQIQDFLITAEGT